MSVGKVEQWLTSIGFRELTQTFVDNGYDDFELCRHLKETDLDHMGITYPSAKVEILRSLEAIGSKNGNTHVYFSMDPNYWSCDLSRDYSSEQILNLSNDLTSTVTVEEPEDLFNRVLRLMTLSGVTPSQLLSFPCKLKNFNSLDNLDMQQHSTEDEEEILCIEDLATVFGSHLKVSQKSVLDVLYRMQRIERCKNNEGTPRSRMSTYATNSRASAGSSLSSKTDSPPLRTKFTYYTPPNTSCQPSSSNRNTSFLDVSRKSALEHSRASSSGPPLLRTPNTPSTLPPSNGKFLSKTLGPLLKLNHKKVKPGSQSYAYSSQSASGEHLLQQGLSESSATSGSGFGSSSAAGSSCSVASSGGNLDQVSQASLHLPTSCAIKQAHPVFAQFSSCDSLNSASYLIDK